MRIFNTKQIALVLMLTLLTISTAAASTASLSTGQYAGGNGGHISSGNGRYMLNGTFGQPNSSTEQGAGRFTFVSGFWGQVEQESESISTIYIPIVQQ